MVAADTATFRQKYPNVSKVVVDGPANWVTGVKPLQLNDAQGQSIDRVTYFKEGDWGTRLRGSGEKRMVSITRSGSTASATMLGNYHSNDRVIISGADQPEYNGTFTISGVVINSGSPYPCTSFNFPVSGQPASPATGILICRLLTDCGHAGWAWSSSADGQGRSLELVNPGLSRDYGQNWKASLVDQGTPGRANSVLATNTAPLILQAKHYPLVPTSTQSVAITARIIDEHPNALTVTLHWRVDAANPGAFSATPMVDDGQHEDGLAEDRVYAGIIPPQMNNAVVEFYVEASDSRVTPALGRRPAWMRVVIQSNRPTRFTRSTTRLTPEPSPSID